MSFTREDMQFMRQSGMENNLHREKWMLIANGTNEVADDARPQISGRRR